MMENILVKDKKYITDLDGLLYGLFQSLVVGLEMCFRFLLIKQKNAW